MTTQAQILAMARIRLGEPVAKQWSDADIRQWINEVAKDIARSTESLRATQTFAAVAGTGSYTPTFTYQPHRIYRVEYVPTGTSTTYSLQFRDPNAMDEVWGSLQSTQSTPSFWTSWGYPPSLTIQVFPVPATAGTFRAWYYRLANVLSTSGSDAATTVDVPDGWDDIVVDGVEYKALRRDSDPRWVEAKQEYEQHREALAESALRFTDAMPVITNASGGNVPAWLYSGIDSDW